MRSVSGLMTGYFEDSRQLRESREVPIAVTKSDWRVLSNPERFFRVYEFDNSPKSLSFFVEELLEFQEKLGHHSKMTIEKDKVTVEVYTHGIERVTGLDKEYIKEADLIFRDSKEL